MQEMQRMIGGVKKTAISRSGSHLPSLDLLLFNQLALIQLAFVLFVELGFSGSLLKTKVISLKSEIFSLAYRVVAQHEFLQTKSGLKYRDTKVGKGEIPIAGHTLD
jgi:hypothetical protein